jgi:hypothetical protein
MQITYINPYCYLQISMKKKNVLKGKKEYLY